MVSRVCYERTSLSPTIQTFILSAIWHGVYPGYYLTFLTGVVMTLAARAVSMSSFSSCGAGHVTWCQGPSKPLAYRAALLLWPGQCCGLAGSVGCAWHVC